MSEALPTGAFARRLALGLAYAAPVAYVCLILAVAVHEVLGHGAVAIACGGTFNGFRLELDGMGWARSDAPDHRVAVLAGGIAVEVALGFALLVALMRRGGPPLLRLAAAVLAVELLHDGLPYGFWDACLAGPRGDVGRILAIVESPALRVGLIFGLGALYLAAFLFGGLRLFREVEGLFGPLSLGRAALIGVALVAGFGVGYATFDWNQLVPGVGARPTVAAVAVQAAVSLVLVLRRRERVERGTVAHRTWAVSIAAAWTCAAAVVALLLLQPPEGWSWE